MNVITAPVMLGSVAAMMMITYSQAIATTYTVRLSLISPVLHSNRECVDQFETGLVYNRKNLV
jgi:hypothetical protein